MKPMRLMQSILDMLVNTLLYLLLINVSHRRRPNHESTGSFPGELVRNADYSRILDGGMGG